MRGTDFGTPARPEEGNGDAEIAMRVAVRVRPLVPKEVLDGSRSCLQVHRAARTLLVGKDREFAFDLVFEERSTQQQTYNEAVAPLVARCFQGYNATVFAYGQALARSLLAPAMQPCFRNPPTMFEAGQRRNHNHAHARVLHARVLHLHELRVG